MGVLVRVSCFTTNQEIQDGGQRESRLPTNAMNVGLQEAGGIYLSQIELNTVKILK